MLSTVGTILSCVPVAYALARMQWRGRQFAFVAVLATLMLPFQVTIVPLYIIFVRLGWIPSSDAADPAAASSATRSRSSCCDSSS